ncbi:MAG TPA: isoprenylcysteine carboxylmethyltransferase family protein [Terriglobia bacterium]|nr:isoprenylcysteine carboxylmethyltransferase family protein [Terriglobia bacterium]
MNAASPMFNGMVTLQKLVDTVALLYAILYFPAPFFWLVIHPFIRFWRRFGNRSFWIAAPLWLAFAAGLILVRHSLFAARIHRSLWTAIPGALMIACGLWIGRQVHHDFGLRRLGGLPEMSPGRYAGGVVSAGIYSRLRHPRYVEYMLTFWGLALLTGAHGIFVLAIVTVLMYLVVAPFEEQELREHYGAAYDAYARAVPRFVPRLRRLRQGAGNMPGT